jgi:hypothetical protein
MKIRQLKQRTVALMMNGCQFRANLARLATNFRIIQDGRSDARWDGMVEKLLADIFPSPVVPAQAEVEAAKIEFVVVKKSTGEVVGTFDSREDAQEMIDKAKRQKKAALQHMDEAMAGI